MTNNETSGLSSPTGGQGAISKSLKRLIFWELGIPISLLTIGIYHGLMQTIYRAGVLHQSA
ncbi:MAG: hypothetical protein ICV79_11655, partial [Flavisolibacter sp.]|nr:hypothetical protein [Flavisolibacter sp.]